MDMNLNKLCGPGCCSPSCSKELDMTEWLNWSELQRSNLSDLLSVSHVHISRYKVSRGWVFIHSYTQSFICTLIHSFVHSFIHSFIHCLPLFFLAALQGMQDLTSPTRDQTRAPWTTGSPVTAVLWSIYYVSGSSLGSGEMTVDERDQVPRSW